MFTDVARLRLTIQIEIRFFIGITIPRSLQNHGKKTRWSIRWQNKLAILSLTVQVTGKAYPSIKSEVGTLVKIKASTCETIFIWHYVWDGFEGWLVSHLLQPFLPRSLSSKMLESGPRWSPGFFDNILSSPCLIARTLENPKPKIENSTGSHGSSQKSRATSSTWNNDMLIYCSTSIYQHHVNTATAHQ